MINKQIIRGLSLIEVMVTVFILATGLLGMAALHTRSLSYSHTANLNTRATMLAYDMLDRIKASPYARSGRGYAITTGSIPGFYPRQCEQFNCGQSQLAAYDIYQWKFIVNQQLPLGDGTIAWVDKTEGREYTITVFFDDSKGASPLRQVELKSVL